MSSPSNQAGSTSSSHPVSYRPQEHYPPSAIPGVLSLPPPNSTPRPFTGDTRTDLHLQNNHSPHFHSGPCHPGGMAYDNHSPFLPASNFNQSYGRHSGSTSDLHAPPNALYHSHSHNDARSESLNLPPPKPHDIHSPLDTFPLPTTHRAFPALLPALTSPSSDHSGDSDSWPNNIAGTAAHEQYKPKKTRREKPHIELAPDQPPTTQGKPRARVYVACLQCRTRKIRCDGAKPVCHNCGRRANGGNECNYDPVPKRRGPDKTPGARQRMARDVRNEINNSLFPRRRRRTRNNSTSETSQATPCETRQKNIIDSPKNPPSNPADEISPTLSPTSPSDRSCRTTDFALVPNYTHSSYSPGCGCHGLVHCPGTLSLGGLGDDRKPISMPTYHDVSNPISPYTSISCGYITELDENGIDQDSAHEIAHEPSLSFTRKIWWDSLLSLYISPSSTRLQSLSASQRESASQGIISDLRFLFRASNHWFSFFHIPTFFGNFYDSSKRESIQPSLVLAMLAMATFWQSSENGLGRQGRERALRFRDEAQAALDASFNAGWVEETLVQAAWLLALFEVCAHPCHSTQRSTSALVMLDSMIHSLSLTQVDADDPNTTLFSPGTVPVVKARAPQFPEYPSSSNEIPTGCPCHNITLEGHWPPSAQHAPMWCSTPAWGDSWSEGEIRKESCRRLCWSSMILAAGHISYTMASRAESLDLFISDPANYALLFSGESLAPAIPSSHSSKNTVWALHDRSFLLWHGCIRMHNNNFATENDKAQFAVKAWLEADSLELTLDSHTCAIERASIFHAREYIFNTRMCISNEFQRYVPLASANVSGLFHRNKANEWLTRQATVAQRLMSGLHTITGNLNNLLARRPFFVFWFMGQIHRALSLWQCDHSLTVALDVCKLLIPAINYLTDLWPCPEQRHRYEALYKEVANACFITGAEPPPPPSSPSALV